MADIEKDNIEELQKIAIGLRWERNLYSGLERGKQADIYLRDIETLLIARTGKAY